MKKKTDLFEFNFKASDDNKNLDITLNKSFKKGEEYNYFYNKHVSMGNKNLVVTYGFYEKDNVQKSCHFHIEVKKLSFNLDKLKLCHKLGCFSPGVYEREKDTKSNYYIFTHTITPNNSNQVINFYRLFFAQNRKVISPGIYEQLKNGLPISYSNEIKANAYLTQYTYGIYNSKPLFNDLIHIKQESRNHYRLNNNFKEDTYQRFKYTIRKNIHYQAYEDKQIMSEFIKDCLCRMTKNIYKDLLIFKEKQLIE